MASNQRARVTSESSTDSSDSYILDGSGMYAVVDVDSDQNLLPVKSKLAGTGTGRNSSTCSHRSLAVTSLVLSVVCLLALSGCAVCYCVYVYNEPTGSAHSLDDEQVCMPCVQLSPNPLAESESPILRQLESHFDQDAETTICCASTPAQYAALFKLILKRQEEVKKIADILGSLGDEGGENDDDGPSSVSSHGAETAVSAHLLTKPVSPQFIDEQGVAMQQWKSPRESPVSHVRRGLKFLNNKIYVQNPGLYFVYCQILYNRVHSDTHPHPRVASNYVKRHSALYPATSGILLKARHTRASGENDRHSSYVGGLFFLHTGDQLFVQVSIPELVSHDDQASFFGLFRVGN